MLELAYTYLMETKDIISCYLQMHKKIDNFNEKQSKRTRFSHSYSRHVCTRM